MGAVPAASVVVVTTTVEGEKGELTPDGSGKGSAKEDVSVPSEVWVADDGKPEAFPVPPAAVDSCAKPTEGGLERKTVYTFFYDL